jgi:amino acid adenylation domain-containing protein
MQAVFGVRADLATYGKVVGGGLPIGILAGSARFMDALDGGMWQYGDDSVPEVPPTFFAGTFVRHPLAMASVLAVLRHLEAQGPELQEALSARTAGMVARLNRDLERRGIEGRIASYGSLFYFDFSHEEPLAGLLYYHLRARGVYVQKGFPCFLTTAHGDAEVERIVRAFAESFDELQAAGIFAPSPRTVESAAPREIALTEQQTEVWLAAQLGDAASCAFNESVTLRLRGALDADALAAALAAVVDRHEALRGTYGVTGERMRIEAATALPLARIERDALRPAEAFLEDFVARDARTPFDLASGPPIRAALLRLGADDHALVLTAHHIACDGWSMNVVLDELAALYSAKRRGVVASLPEPLAFSTYALRLAQRTPAELAEVEAFWRAQYATPVEPLELPTDRPRPAVRSFAGATRSLRLDAARYAALKRAGAREGCTLFVTLLAAFNALIGRLARRDDVVVGVPAAGQAQYDGEVLVGHCVDFLPVRTTWEPQASFRDLLGVVKQRVLDAYEHQQYTLGTLVRALDLPRASNRVALAEIQFNLERLADGLDMAGLQVEVQPNPKGFVNFDLFLNAIESRDGLRFDCDYNAELYDASTVDAWLDAYVAILDAVVADPSAAVAADAGASVLCGEVRALAPDATVHGLFEASAAKRPDAVAAVCGDARLTYRELDARANRLAHELLAVTGGSEKLVGILLDRSLDMLVALLAVLKAGCAYVPLDPTHPRARLHHILGDANVAALVIDAGTDPALAPSGVPAIHLARDAQRIAARPESAPAVARSGAALAYAIYTSGSTGVPKGVEIEHRSVVNLLGSMARRPGLSADDVLMAVTTIAFDIAALELFLPLSVGARVVIADPEESADGLLLARRLETARVTTLQATPASWRLLLEAGFRPPQGFTMLCGGEALPPDLAAQLLATGGALWNVYGPTETTIWSSCARVVDATTITAGVPVDNTQVHVLDDARRPVRIGAVGHVHIAGDGLARGYVGRADLTAEKFFPNPFGPGRIYATGDRGRIAAGGEIEILGRSDHQVKLRGYRIELGEIETALARTGKVSAAAVALREDAPGEPRLVAYYVERAGAPVALAELRGDLAAQLPKYMVPATWVRLDALPLTPNGKLDRSALPAPGEAAAPVAATAEGALTATERALARICEEVLRLDRVGASDDLFALGADSIQLFQITARANRDGLPVAAKHVFAHRTIGALAKHLDLARSS